MGLSFTKHLFSVEKKMSVLMVGLGGVGKTTILNKLKLGEVVPTTATVGFEVVSMEYKEIEFTIFELGGLYGYMEEEVIGRHCFPFIRGVVFVVDSTDRARVEEAREELYRILNKDELARDVALLVFANKQDLPNAMTNMEIIEKLHLNDVGKRKWYIQGTCATSGEGLYNGLECLSNTIN